jgi:uncharacterized protein (TIGR02145 family)
MRNKLTHVRANSIRPLLAAGFVLALAFTFSCSSGDDGPPNGGGNDKGNDIANYRTVVIGTQEWMAENLNYAIEGSKCVGTDIRTVEEYTYYYLEDKNANCEKYGRLYDWNTAMAVCPKDWHLPSRAEWKMLIDYVEAQKFCTDCAGRYLKTTSGWYNDGNGTDDWSFSALPGGRGWDDGEGFGAGNFGGWWSSSENEEEDCCVYTLVMYYDDGRVSFTGGADKPNLYSVRCVMD